MKIQYRISMGALGAVAALAFIGTSADALTMKECSAKYKTAQTAGSLNGMKWNDFRKAECGTDSPAAAAPAPRTTASAPAATAPAPKTTAAKTTAARTSGSAPAAKPVETGNAVFPSAVSAKYSSESAGKARMHTCLDQYKANKTSGGNGGLVWIQKGGGYYSECNKRLNG
jgi:hypothetical protein